MKPSRTFVVLFLFGCMGGPHRLGAQPRSFEIRTQFSQTAVSGALSPDGKKLFVGTGNEKVGGSCELLFLDAVTGKQERSITMPFHWTAAVAVSPDGKLVACGGANAAEVRVYNTASGTLVASLFGHGGAQSIAFHPDNNRLAVGGDDRSIRVWDVASKKQIHRLEGHVSWVGSLSFRDARHLASGSDKEIRFWDVSSGRSRGVLRGHTSVVTDLVHSKTGNLLYSCGRDKTVRAWDLNAFREIHVFHGHTQEVLGIALSKDGKTLYSGAGDCFRADQRSEVKRWDVAGLRLDREWLGPLGRVHLVTLADEGRLVGIVGGGFDNRGLPLPTDWKLYDSATGREN